MLTILLSTLLTGTWIGTGKAVMNPQTQGTKSLLCQEIALDLEQEPQKLNWKAGNYICEDLHATYGASEFQIKNGELILQGTSVGKIQNGHLELRILDPSDGSTFHLTLTLRANNRQLDYQEQWFEGNDLKLEITGTLTKRQSKKFQRGASLLRRAKSELVAFISLRANSGVSS